MTDNCPNNCPLCKEPYISQCRCAAETAESLANGHGRKCKNGHVWSISKDGKVITKESNMSEMRRILDSVGSLTEEDSKKEVLSVKNRDGNKFNVVLVKNGQKYGRNDVLANEGETLVEFYDARYPHTQYGQFVSRYSVSTIMKAKSGIQLDGGVPGWFVDASNVGEIKDWIWSIDSSISEIGEAGSMTVLPGSTNSLADRIQNESETTVECLPEEISVRGNAIASGDEAQDREVEDKIISDLEHNPWAWCTVKVTSTWHGLTATDYLGACSYDSEEDFMQSGYYEDMRSTTLSEIKDKAEKISGSKSAIKQGIDSVNK